MTCKEVLDLAGLLLGESEVKVRVPQSSTELVRLCDSVCEEICAEYFPLEQEEEVSSEGDVPLSVFRKRVTEVLWVKRAGQRIGFKLKPFFLVVAPGSLRVKYRYLPEPSTSESAVLEVSPLVGIKTVALGVASEFALSKGFYEEALALDRRFRDGLDGLVERRVKRLSGRSFL